MIPELEVSKTDGALYTKDHASEVEAGKGWPHGNCEAHLSDSGKPQGRSELSAGQTLAGRGHRLLDGAPDLGQLPERKVGPREKLARFSAQNPAEPWMSTFDWPIRPAEQSARRQQAQFGT